MENIFIGWSGNQSLANELAAHINALGQYHAIVGGGTPQDIHVGAQVLNQINRCTIAILLIEDKNGQISPNLMFEWGYLMAKLPVANIHSALINKSQKELPTDLLGAWVAETHIDRENTSEATLAKILYEKFLEGHRAKTYENYFDIINNWKTVFARLSELKDSAAYSDECIAAEVIFGCLASYYYTDQAPLRRMLDTISGSEALNEVVAFAKAYLEVFLDSKNMMAPQSQNAFFSGIQTFEMILGRTRKFSPTLDLFIDVLCNNAYGLSSMLYIRNENLDDATKEFCADKARECLGEMVAKIREFDARFPGHKCLSNLIASYGYNDLAHLYRDHYRDREKFLEYLALSVSERQKLFQNFQICYPQNSLLTTKFEQEYYVALSEQCQYMENSFMKKLNLSTIAAKFSEWERDLVYSSSLTDRIKRNLGNAEG